MLAQLLGSNFGSRGCGGGVCVCVCLLISRFAPLLLKHPAFALFQACLLFFTLMPYHISVHRHTLPSIPYELPSVFWSLLSHNPLQGCCFPPAKPAVSPANLPVPVCFFPCHHFVPSSSSLGKEMTNCHFLKHPLFHQLLLKRQWDKWNSAFERLNSSRKYSTHKWGASKSIPSS